MVFEAVVVELLNKFLNQYIENLDTSQLKIGIWGGDVVLKNMKIKSTVFDDLNLPVRVKWGKLGKLFLKIPWKNLYSAPAVIEIHDLLLVIVPNIELKYDPVKEEKWAQEKKQAKLKAVEEAKKREIEEGPAQKDSFVEKLITQIIKNLEFSIKNIHIRYEDKSTIPGSPFSVGITMSNLSAKTAGSDLALSISVVKPKEENFICKEINLEGFAVYWNSGSVLFSDLPDVKLIDVMVKSIPKSDYKPEGFLYMFGPLSASGFLRLNPKPELDGSNFKIPKVFINVHLKEIELAVTSSQFCDIMAYMQDFNRFLAATKYRKYRPVNVPVNGHAKEWWRFACTAILEDITRRKAEWSWTNIKRHRDNCKKYSKLFKLKLVSKKMSAEDAKALSELEKDLNVFNLILLREQVYVEVERSVTERHNSGSWFSGWFGFGGEARPDSTEDEIVKKIQSVMTIQEKQKLYKAIGYEESDLPTNYPVEFVEFQFWFHLDEIKATVYYSDTKDLAPIMISSIKSVKMELEKRPSGDAMKFVLIIGNFEVIGKQDIDESYPELVTSHCHESQSLIELVYETHPLDASCDQRIIFNAMPLRIIYHAETINVVQEVFKTSDSDEMERIMAVTSASLPTFQKITSLGLQYAIEKRTELEVKVNIMSSYLIIPYEGIYHPEKDMLVLMFGKLTIETEENTQKNISIKEMSLGGTTAEEIFSKVLSASYTKFKCQLTGVQILFQVKGEDWVSASNMQRSSLQFLGPTNVQVTIKKSLVTDDARIPKMIIEGKMPSIEFNFSEERFVSFIALVSSIQIKREKRYMAAKKTISSSAYSVQSFSTQLENTLKHIQKEPSVATSSDYVQGIDLKINFEMSELSVNVTKTIDKTKPGSTEKKFLNLSIIKLEMNLTKKTFEVMYLFKLGRIDFRQYYNKKWLDFLSGKEQEHEYLFVAEIITLDTKIPDFYTTRGAVVNRLTLKITPLNVSIDKTAVLAQIKFIKNVQRRIDLVTENAQFGHIADSGTIEKETIYEEPTESKKVITKGKRFRRKSHRVEVIDYFLEANLDELDIVFEFDGNGLAEFKLQGGGVEISSRKAYSTVDLNIEKVLLIDLNPDTKHPKIMTSLENRTLASRVTVYDKEYYGGENSLDMAIEAAVGGIQCTFVNFFFVRVVDFLFDFQNELELLKQSATIAAKKAKENMVKALHNAAEICLRIQITAPILLIPKTSVSMEALLVDLGELTVKNSILELDYTPDGGETLSEKPILDVLKVHLQNLKMGRCVLNKDSDFDRQEKIFLVPITFDLNIKRNLSRNWFKVIPEAEIIARLAAVRVTLTNTDLKAILRIIEENLKEGIEVRQSFSPQKSQRKHHNEPKAHGAQNELSSGTKNVKDTGGYYTLIKFAFFMESFVFEAITSSKDKEEEDVALARLLLENMSVKGRMYSNNSIYTSMMLVSCVLDDTRPGKEGRLTRLMERTTDVNVEDSKSEENQNKSMLEIVFQKKEENSYVDIRVYKFTLILSMEFLQKLIDFFTGDEDATEESLSLKTKPPERVSGKKESIRYPTFTINIRLEKPDIIFVENMNSTEVDALVFHTELIVKYRTVDFKQVISGTIADIELYVCRLSSSKLRRTYNQIIQPFTLSLAGSTPEGTGLHIDICVTDIFISINPSTVDLVSKCWEALMKNPSINEDNRSDEVSSDLWEVKPFNENDFWFFQTEYGEDALALESSSSLFGEENRFDQVCLLAIPSIVVLIEEVPTGRTKPLLLFEIGYRMRCNDWSRKLTVNSTFTLQSRYFNTAVFDWEPIIEPIEKYSETTRQHFYVPWELNFQVVCGEESELEEMHPPKVQFIFSCKDVLQVTLTKTSVEVLKSTLDKYTSAMTKHVVKKLPYLPPYVIKNETELVAELLLESSKLQVWKSFSDDYDFVRLDSNSEVELQSYYSNSSEQGVKARVNVERRDTKLFLKFPKMGNSVFEIPLGLPVKRYYPFSSRASDLDEVSAFVSDITIVDNSVTVVLRSVFTVINYFKDPINVHILTEDGRTVEYMGTVEGNSKFTLPLHAVYAADRKIFFSVNGYSLSVTPFDWNNLNTQTNVSCLLQCNSKVPERQDPFFIQAAGETEEIYYTNTTQKTPSSVIFNLHLQPTIKVFNSLPYPLVICFQGRAEEEVLQPGNSYKVTSVEPGSSTLIFRIDNYLEKEWSYKVNIENNPPEFLVWDFVSYNGLAPETLELGVYVSCKRSTNVFTVYCPYLMINKTECLLSYKFKESSTVFYHPSNYKLPIMFSPSSKKFFSKKHANLQVDQSSWSEKFSVDAAGSGGTITCEDPDSNRVYKISVTIYLTYNRLTRIIIFTPSYILINSLDYDIECQESDRLGEPWIEIPSRDSVPFWPWSQDERSTIRVRPKGSHDTTPDFEYRNADACLLRLSQKTGGIFVTVRPTQSSTYIKFTCYEPGLAPVLILNSSHEVCVIQEPNTDYKVTLNPYEKVLHAWFQPTGERKVILNAMGDNYEEVSLLEDTEGFLSIMPHRRLMFLTFLDGTQRVLIITEDEGLSRSISSAKMMNSGAEVIFRIEGIGVSLVNDFCQKEILYLSLSSSDILWESKKPGKKRFKRMKDEDSFYIENAYQTYLEEREKNAETDPILNTPNHRTIDFRSMMMIEPYALDLRRTFESGLWLVYRQIYEQMLLHIKVNRIQVDSQLLESTFSVVLAPVPPPKTVAADYPGSKPFIEVSIVRLGNHKTGVGQYKYFKILVQEFHVKMDIMFIQSVYQFMEAAEMTDEQEKEKFNRDLEFVGKPLKELAEIASSTEQKNFYQLLHFSPLKIHFSFSMAENLQTNPNLPPALSVMLLSIGITLTDVHDVVFRLSYMEKNSTFLTNQELLNEVISHYYGQIIRQAYVLLLGLDVIGNPFGLIVGIGQGVEAFFYEPFQGMIRGPSEFGKGVALGCRGLVKHTVGSAAGTLGKLTGTLGKGLAALSMDKEYQMQRMVDREQHASLHASMARGGKGLFMGVVEGFTGVVKKPIKGAQEDGFGGFFKGVGKGMLGLVTRPATGILDFASTSFNVVKRAATHGSETKRLRPPRFFRNEILVEPYNLKDAEGNYIFYFASKRKYSKTDKYCYHEFLKGNEVVLLTNKRIILAEFNDTFGSWQEHMAIMWKSMPERPRAHTKGIALTMPKRSEKVKPEVKVLLIESEDVKKILCEKMIELYYHERRQIDEFEMSSNSESVEKVEEIDTLSDTVEKHGFINKLSK